MLKLTSRNGVIVRTPIERLRALLAPNAETGCHEWTGALDRKGYARITIANKRQRLAHRVAYEHAKGPIPDGLTLDHLCRNKRCCNPDHLEPVTLAENSRRYQATRWAQGVCERGHELTESNIYRSPGRGTRSCRACWKVAADNRRSARALPVFEGSAA